MGAILEKFDAATRKVTDDRGAVYGHPIDDFGRIVRLKEVVAECPDRLLRHALEMIAVKMARLIETPGHMDSWIDIAGYARTAAMVIDRRVMPEPETLLQTTAPIETLTHTQDIGT